jgi:hypothetical protein
VVYADAVCSGIQVAESGAERSGESEGGSTDPMPKLERGRVLVVVRPVFAPRLAPDVLDPLSRLTKPGFPDELTLELVPDTVRSRRVGVDG